MNQATRPTYPQLNPYLSMVDATTYEQGNLRLMPEKSSNLLGLERQVCAVALV